METAPPSVIFSVPLPNVPTNRLLEFVQSEPAPSTVAVPVEKELLPITLDVAETVPPFWIFSVPLPELPTFRLLKFV